MASAMTTNSISAFSSLVTNDQIQILNRHIQQQQFAAAFDICADAIRANPSDWNALYLAGITLRFRSDFAGAVTYYRRALQIAPNIAEIWLALGIALQSLGQFPDAIHAFHTAVRLDPEHNSAHNSLGLTYVMAGDYVSAMHAYQDALQVCANRAYNTVRSEHPEYFRIEQRGEERVMVMHPAYQEATRQILATDFSYYNTLRNMVSCCVEMGDHQRAAQLQAEVDTCTPIYPDLIGPMK